MIDEMLKIVRELMLSCYNHPYFWHILIAVAVVLGIFIVWFYGGDDEGTRRRRRDRDTAERKKRRILKKNPFDTK